MTPNPGRLLFVSILTLAAGLACEPRDGDPGISAQEEEPGVLFRQKNPTHQLVCSCTCASSESDPNASTETHETPTTGSCVDYDNIKCTKKNGDKGRLRGCTRESVPKASVVTLGEWPLLLGEKPRGR